MLEKLKNFDMAYRLQRWECFLLGLALGLGLAGLVVNAIVLAGV